MGFFCTILYILLSVICPWEIVPSLAQYRLAFWAGTVGLIASITTLASNGTSSLRVPQIWLFVGFVFSTALSTMVNQRWLGALPYVVVALSVPLTMYLLVLWNADSFRRLKWTLLSTVVASLVLCIQGMVAIQTGWDSWRVLFPYADESKGQTYFGHDEEFEAVKDEIRAAGDGERVRDLFLLEKAAAMANGTLGFRVRGNGVMQDPNDFALGLIVSLPFCFLLRKEGKRIRNLIWVWLPIGAITLTVYYTRSRGGMLALAGIATLYSSRRWGRKSWILLIVLALAMSAAHFTGGRSMTGDESSEGRINAWSEGYHMWMTHPLLGVGYGAFTDFNEITAHNAFVLCFSETGVLGYFFWIGIIVTTMIQLSALTKVEGDDENSTTVRRWAGLLQYSMTGFLVGAFFLSRTYVYLLYLLAAFVCGLVLIARKNSIDIPLPKPSHILKTVLMTEFATISSIYVIMRVGRFT